MKIVTPSLPSLANFFSKKSWNLQPLRMSCWKHLTKNFRDFGLKTDDFFQNLHFGLGRCLQHDIEGSRQFRHFLGWIGLLFLSIFSPQNANARGHFNWTNDARQAYQLATQLRFAESKTTLQRMENADADNLLRPFIENYIDFLTVFLNENKSEYNRLRKNLDPRLERLAKGDRSAPEFLYCQAEMRLQWAIARGKFGDYLTAINETKQAYALLEENRKKHPQFAANLKSLGVLHALVGTVPNEYRWAIRMFGGMRGTIEQGLREVEQAIDFGRSHPDFVFAKECVVAYSFLLKHLGNQSDAAWQTIQSSGLNPSENPLEAFAVASLAMKTGRNDEAIRVLEKCPTGSQFHPFPYRDFLLGICKLQRLDWDANQPLERFLKTFGGIYGIKEAYQKLAWHWLIAGSREGYQNNIGLAKTQGNDRFEPDQAAEREAKSGEVPDPILLKSRLLFDGGYYQRAYDLLKNLNGNFVHDPRLHLEYQYRMGRISHNLKRWSEAVDFYEKTIRTGSRMPQYFACNAALQLGLLHEDRRQLAEARKSFERCLEIEPEEYGASLHARAKAGLNRLKG